MLGVRRQKGNFVVLKQTNVHIYYRAPLSSIRCGLLSIVCLILFSILSFNILWSILGWIIAFLLVFIEIPLCMKCCPTSAKFDNFLTQFQNSYFRATAYIVFAVILWLAVGVGGRTLQVISALVLTFGAISYIIAALRNQTPASSTITGGAGVSTIV
ncbi:Golgi apparatus membrane protein tvp18 [Mortierella sp. GBA30]|nr:Golgi apparatus membrane protein tvp18 [Mortierella sp. GBA30]